ncbi:MAG: M1 family metallopeptidase [Myxococcota bacterium]
MIRRAISVAAACMWLSGCGAAAVTDTSPEPSAAPEHTLSPTPFTTDGQHRYARNVVPQAYRIALTVDPREARFQGQVEIDVEIAALTDGRIVLHGKDMNVHLASIESDGVRVDATVEAGPNGALSLRATPPPAAPGKATLYLAYDAPLGQVPEGLYRTKEGENWYAYTQFEPLEARSAFPCFDQPEFKTPFSFRMTVPKGMTALTNTPEISRTNHGAQTLFEFDTSKPLPTYLIAFAVGEMDLVAAPPGAFPNGLSFRVATVKGRGTLTDYVMKTTPGILDALSTYFGQPYPYAKLDYVAVPNFAAGAMENVGLVTYREPLILLDEGATPAARRSSLGVNAHELAHMWFGNLVTPQWWDDLWLNEAFATWMGTKVVGQVAPEFESSVDAIGGTQWAMGLDTQADARAVRNPIKEAGDIYNAFDGITYTKGRAILGMTEAWIGVDNFREGVRAYMRDKAHGVATGDDLFNALGAASGRPVREMLSTFTDQPGVPLIEVTTQCGGKRFDSAKVTLRQRRFLPKGSKADKSTQWRVPICLRYGIGGSVQRECIELSTPESTIELGVAGCPDWLHPNADEQGYYRWQVPTASLTALATVHRERLTLPERVALPGHLSALYEAGGMNVATFLDTLTALAKDPHPLVIEGILSGLYLVENASLSDAAVGAFAKRLRTLARPILKRIGRKASAKEDPQTRMLRPAIIRLLAGPGQDKRAISHANTMTKRFLEREDAITADERGYALRISAWSGDEALWEGLRAALDRASSPAIRKDVMNALANFRAPPLLDKTLALLLDGTLRAQDLRTVARRAMGHRMTRTQVWEWMVRHYAKVLELMGDKYVSRFPRMAQQFCAPAQRAAVVFFFKDEAHRASGTERNLGLALERIDRCIRLRNDTQEALDSYLKVTR